MIDYLAAHQLNYMLVLCGMSAIIAFFVLITTAIPKKRRMSLLLMEVSSTLLLMFDRFAYIYRGDVSITGYYMVRISNFMVYLMTFLALLGFNIYLAGLLDTSGNNAKPSKRLTFNNIILIIGMVLIVISQFTGLFYTFDENNRYQRSSWFFISYLIPFIVLILEFTIIINYWHKLNLWIRISMLLFTIIPIIATLLQVVLYGLSLINMSVVLVSIILYVFTVIDENSVLEKAHKQEIDLLTQSQKSASRLFEQTATAFAESIDLAKNHVEGHSKRVAKYAREIAERAGKNEAECQEVYFAALLHDVGKLEIPDSILLKKDDLDAQEQTILEEHVKAGERILSVIGEYPYLSKGARYHHERYDGTGYPDNLKGNEIPEIVRIISVADAYDVMTSKTLNRNAMPQSNVREEIIRGEGTRFDPKFSKIMLQMIDADQNYEMRGDGANLEKIWKSELICDSYRSDISTGVPITQDVKRINMNCRPLNEEKPEFSMPAIILYDSLDGFVHRTEQTIKDYGYFEYGEIWFDGHTTGTWARNIETNISESSESFIKRNGKKRKDGTSVYEIEIGRYRDHVRVRIMDHKGTIEVIAALPDSTRFTYLGISGENCHITDISVTENIETLDEGSIPRIAGEISYVNRMESDLKNVQIDGYRSASTESIPVRDKMRIEFHSQSLPTANLVWHCPYIVLFDSADHTVNGDDYREFVLIRLDGEIAEEDEKTENRLVVTKNETFESWDAWKEINKIGLEYAVYFKKKGNRITVTSENLGIKVTNTTILEKDVDEVYMSITGDQCAITDIRIY